MKNPVLWAIVASFAFVTGELLPYVGGRINFWLFPVDLVPPQLLLLCCAMLFALLVRSLVVKRDLKRSVQMVCVAVAFLIGRFAVRPADIFHRGFANYARNALTADEWRAIARLAQDKLGPSGWLPSPKKNLWEESEHRALWSEFTAKTKIQKLTPALVLSVQPGRTSVTWGSALVGHRSVTIYANGIRDVQSEDVANTIRIAGDIVTQISSD